MRVWAPMKRLALACLFVLGILPNALALQVIEPEGDRGPFFINFRYPHMFFSFYIDTPAEVSLDFEAGQRGGLGPSKFLCFLNSHYTLEFSLQEGQRFGRYRLYLGPVLRGRHSVRIDLVQPKKEREAPEVVMDRVRFLGAEPGDGQFSVLRHTPLYILEAPEREAPLFGRFWYKETDQGLELAYGLTTTCASDGQELVRALETTGLPFRQFETLSARISPFGLILGLDVYQNGRLAPFQGHSEGTHPLLSLNLASGELKEAKALPKEGVYRVDPTRYRSLNGVAFFEDLPRMLALANGIAKRSDILEGTSNPYSQTPADLSFYLFSRFHLEENTARGPFGLEVELADGTRLKTKGATASPDRDGVFGFAVKSPRRLGELDVARFRVLEGQGGALASNVTLDQVFALDTDRGTYAWRASGQTWYPALSGYWESTTH